MSETRPTRTCDQCGQTDDHPRIFIGNGPAGSKHYDCLSYTERAAVAETNADVSAIVDVCVDGLRGPDLLDHIVTTHKEA